MTPAAVPHRDGASVRQGIPDCKVAIICDVSGRGACRLLVAMRGVLLPREESMMSSSESGRLLGLMAFCMGLIDQQKLDEVCDAPAQSTDQEIRERLARQGGLSPDELSVLEQ